MDNWIDRRRGWTDRWIDNDNMILKNLFPKGNCYKANRNDNLTYITFI